MLFLKIGFKNLFKNFKRTLIACLAVGIGIAALIFVDGLLIGYQENMTQTATNNLLSQGQIQNREYELTGDPKFVIHNIEDIRSRLNDLENIQFSERTLNQGMITGARGAKNGLIYGVDPKNEEKVTKVHKFITSGEMPQKKSDIVLGSQLVNDLKLSMGDRVILTFSNVSTGELVQALFRLSGIVQFGSKSIDSSIVFIGIDTARGYLGLEGQSNQIALNFGDPNIAGNKALPFWNEFSSKENSAKGWNTLVPAVESMKDYSKLTKVIMISMLGLLVAIGIVNTLFMSIMERIYEFGVIRAIGTSKFEVVKIIMFEALGLGLLSSFIGCILSLVITFVININGISMDGVEYNTVTFIEPVFVYFQPYQYIMYPIIITFITMAVSLYPAIFACRIRPTEAMGNRI